MFFFTFFLCKVKKCVYNYRSYSFQSGGSSMHPRSCSHFTIIEILVVIAVIAILMGSIFGITDYVSRRNGEARSLATVEMLRAGLEQYKEKFGYYPPTVGRQTNGYVVFELDVFSPDATKSNHPERMMQNNFNQFIDFNHLSQQKNSDKVDVSGSPSNSAKYKIKDGFGNYIYYRCPGYVNKTAYDLGSLGSDGKLGDGSDKAVTSADSKDHFGKGDDITNCRR